MGLAGLHCCAYLGTVGTKWELSVTNAAGNTAIMWAARKGMGHREATFSTGGCRSGHCE